MIRYFLIVLPIVLFCTASCNTCRPKYVANSSKLQSWDPYNGGSVNFVDDSAQTTSFSVSTQRRTIESEHANEECAAQSTEEVTTSLTNSSLQFELNLTYYWNKATLTFDDVAFKSWSSVVLGFDENATFDRPDTLFEVLPTVTLHGHAYNDVIHVKKKFFDNTVAPVNICSYEIYWARNVGLVYFGQPGTNKYWHLP